jgi:hypothetical protein
MILKGVSLSRNYSIMVAENAYKKRDLVDGSPIRKVDGRGFIFV